MNLRDQAATLARRFLENSSSGFGVDVTIHTPEGQPIAITGFLNDIAQALDPQTGALVAGRTQTLTVSIKPFTELGIELPRGIADRKAKPWRVTWTDARGEHVRKVSEARPDRGLEITVLFLEAHSLGA